MPPAFCFLDRGRIRSGNQVLLGGTQTYSPKGPQRSESGSGNQLWMVRVDGERVQARQGEEQMLLWLV